MKYKILVSLLRTARSYGRLKSKSFNLNNSETLICTYLYTHESVTQEAIARAQLMDKTTVAKSLRQLENRGYIYKHTNPENRRENMIFLAEQGKADVRQICEEHKNWFNKVCEGIEEEQLTVFFEVANKMLTKAKVILKEEEDK